MDYRYTLPMKVRDYECDLQGIVNNANYQHYTEHTRHEFILSEGISFSDLHDRGIDCVVARITMFYKTPLRSGDEFLSCLNVAKERARYVFYQDIYRLPDHKLAMRATVDVVCLVDGKLVVGVEELDALLR
ncbi:MAG: acyl-CoA thioesterase [Bacteroidaceae bacterium]|nr:acyl-CoA thioesterase [Bacteroidaceae bacterium]